MLDFGGVMNLPRIDYFENGPQTVYRGFTQGFKDGHVDWTPSDPVIINNYVELAELAMSDINVVDQFVDSFLTLSVMKPWRQPMGGAVPFALSKYQKKHVETKDVDAAIASIGVKLSAGQKLYRGGLTLPGIQSNVLSTTFSPAVAINEALWRGKAETRGILSVYVLEVVAPVTSVYVFKQHGSNLGHEKEVVFASGARVAIGGVARTGSMLDGMPYEIVEATIS